MARTPPLFIAVPFFLALAGDRAASAQPVPMRWIVNGVERRALVAAPKTGSGKAPLVFFFHAHGGNMQAAASGVALHTLWPEAIVVYPQGLPTAGVVDPKGLHPGWQHEPGEQGDRDLELFDTMLASLREKYAVDEARIYAAGFSNGAIFSYVLFDQRAKTLAAMASVAGRMVGATRPRQPLSALLISGRKDVLVPYAAFSRALAEVRRVDGAVGDGQPCGPGCTIYRSASGIDVAAVVHEGGHVFPPGAAERIVTYFQRHPAPR